LAPPTAKAGQQAPPNAVRVANDNPAHVKCEGRKRWFADARLLLEKDFSTSRIIAEKCLDLYGFSNFISLHLGGLKIFMSHIPMMMEDLNQ